MIFTLKHAVGNRERWRTTTPLTAASAEVLADEVASVDGVTGVSVNVRTGSVVLTVDSLEAKRRTAAYFASLAKNPLYYRVARKKSACPERPAASAACPKLPRDRALRNDLPALEARSGAARSAASQGFISAGNIIEGTVNEIGRGFTRMPLLAVLGRIREMVTEALSGVKRGKNALTRAAASSALLPVKPEDGAELDFSSLARYVFLRPVLPMIVNIGNAVLGALPIIAEGLKNLFKGKLNVPVLDAAALIVSLLRRDFKTVGLLVVLLGLGEML